MYMYIVHEQIYIIIDSELHYNNDYNIMDGWPRLYVKFYVTIHLLYFIPHSSLLAEYHALYELQRKRLEDQVVGLTTEKELWQQASYDLAHRVAEQCCLQTVQRLQLGEKAWCKLMGHFAVVLSDKDTQQVNPECVCCVCVCVCE